MRIRPGRRLRTAALTLIASFAVAVGVASAENRVRAVNYDFKPATITIRKGQEVTWKRVEGRHTVTFNDGSYDKTLNKRHPRRSRTFNKVGTFRYHCRIHAYLNMKGKVVVE